ncbi:MAG TPA: sulfotransferase [Caulobacteraceae bacterium]|nr:sulfotransferase [Caulobacteraceae bacterium]
MRSGLRHLRVRIALVWRAFLIDISNFYLLEYRSVAGHLVSGKNSGTHWLRFMLSHALAHRYGLSPPARSSGRLAEDFVGHPRWPRRHQGLPFIAGSHNLPSIVFSWAWLRRLLRLPPIVVLVRDPKQAMLSHFVKWRGPLDLTMEDYVLKASTKRRQLANAWWYIDFFNRWGRIAASAPAAVLVVRYEDLQAAPAHWLARISAHLKLDLDAASIDAAMTVCSRGVVRDTLDPAYGETIVPDVVERASARFSSTENHVLSEQFEAHMRWDFGYGHARRSSARPALAPAGAVWARAVFLLAAGYAVFDQFGAERFDFLLAKPWGQVELCGVFFLMTLLGPQSFPRLRALTPAGLALIGGGVELAQHSRLAPGVGSVSDVMAELAGIAAATGLVQLIATRARQVKVVSSLGPSLAGPAAEAPPGRLPG